MNWKFLPLLFIFLSLFFVNCGKTVKLPLDKFGDAAVHIGGIGDAVSFVTQNRYSYVASAQGIFVIDHRDFANVKVVNQLKGKFDDLLLIEDDLIYALTAGGRLSIIQITDDTNLKIVNQPPITFPGPYVKMSKSGTTLAIASGSDGLYFFNISNKLQPEAYTIFRHDEIKEYNSVTLTDEYAFLSAVDASEKISVKVIDYLHSEGPVLLNSFASNLNLKNSLATPGIFPLQTTFYNDKLWATATLSLQGMDPLTTDMAQSILTFEETPINLYLSDYLKMGFNGDIEGYVTGKVTGKQAHFILTTKGTARSGVMADKQILVADGKEGFIVADAQKLIEKVQTMFPGAGIQGRP